MSAFEQITVCYQHWMLCIGIIQTLILLFAALVALTIGRRQTKISKDQADISARLLTNQLTTTELTAISSLLNSIHSQLQYPNISSADRTRLEGMVGTYHGRLHGALQSIGRGIE
jgi:hypothetical protein